MSLDSSAASANALAQLASLDKLAPDYVRAWGEMPNALKNAKNPHLGNDYVDLEGMLAVAKPVFAKYQLALFQGPGELNADGTRVSVTTMLIHSSGQRLSIKTELPCVATRYNKKTGETVSECTAQTVGSAITYAKRYAVQSIAGIAPTDDDGNAASAPPEVPPMDPDTKNAFMDAIAKAVAAKDKRGLEALRDQVNECTDEDVKAAFLDGRAALKKIDKKKD
jgi:hypothetical protein